MEKTIGIFLLIAVICGSCREKFLTGDLTVIIYGASEIGLYDPATPTDGGFFVRRYAIRTSTIAGNKVEFNNVNVGNYVVAVLNTTVSRAVQVQGDKRTTVDLVP